MLPEAVREAGDVALPNGDTIHKFLVVNKVGPSCWIQTFWSFEPDTVILGHLSNMIN